MTIHPARDCFVVRSARSSDAIELPGIERSAGCAFRAIESLAWLAEGDDHSVAAHLAHIDAETSWVCTDPDDAPIGFLIGDVIRDTFHIAELSVRLDRQRSGAGSLLMTHLVDWARRRGLRAISLTTFRDVAWNAPFYSRFGFREMPWHELDQLFPLALEREAAVGLPRELRCAMQLVLEQG